MNDSIKQSYLKVVFVVVATVLTVAQLASSQMSGGRSSRSMMRGPAYDLSTETTVKGVVSEVQQITVKPGGGGASCANCPREWAGTQLKVKTDGGAVVVVHVGPTDFLASQNFSFEQGDKLTVLGSKLQHQGIDFIIAKEITKGNDVLKLRDSKGFPLWAGPRRGM